MINTITLSGNLTANPALNDLPSGKQVCKFRIGFKTGEKSSFIDCEAWQEKAKTIADSVIQGTRIIIGGRLRIDEFTNKDGKQQSKAVITVDSWEIHKKSELI